MSGQITSAIVHTVLSFASLCVFFLPSLVCAGIKHRHARTVFFINLALFFMLQLIAAFVVGVAIMMLKSQ
jgi:hypothetical protein